MQSYLAGQDVNLTISLGSLTVSAISYQILDETSSEVLANTPLVGFVSESAEANILVPALLNATPVGKTSAARVIRLFLTTTGAAQSVSVIDYVYLLKSSEPLVVPTSSFQPLVGAELVASELTGLDSWSTATDEQKITALREAYGEIIKLNLRYISEDWQSRVSLATQMSEEDWATLSLSTWNTFEPIFRTALCKAQVAHADSLLSGGGIDATEDRIIQKVVGESSTTWTKARPAKSPLSKKAMRFLAGYIESVKIGRA